MTPKPTSARMLSLCIFTLAYFIAINEAHAGPSGKEVTKRQTDSSDSSDSNEGLPPFIELLRGRDGRDGRDEEPGPKGMKGDHGDKGDPGLQGLPGPASGGAVYVRWGRTTCPNTPATELVYSGRAAGTHFSHKGGTSDYLCLPDTPQYSTYWPGVQGYSPIYGAEYEIEHDTLPLPGVRDDNVPCALCRNSQRSSVFVLPARTSCPSSWTREYYGYLTTANILYGRRDTACVDKHPETVPGGASDIEGALFYNIEAVCHGILCPPYDPEKELTCAVAQNNQTA